MHYTALYCRFSICEHCSCALVTRAIKYVCKGCDENGQVGVALCGSFVLAFILFIFLTKGRRATLLTWRDTEQKLE